MATRIVTVLLAFTTIRQRQGTKEINEQETMSDGKENRVVCGR